ncbi:MAG: sigma-70 family RNA polymerase sigma factor [Pirellulales bacterium]|nr:sigma-70 family RNA polymerase sigma factor [Pirellulales bacterium]
MPRPAVPNAQEPGSAEADSLVPVATAQTHEPLSNRAVQESRRLLQTRKKQTTQEAADQLVQIIEDHQLAIFAFFRARVLQNSDAEDLTQEVFLRYHTGRARFDESREMRPYLMGIARNLLRERARKLKNRKEVSWTEMCLELENEPPEGLGVYEDVVDFLPECLNKLGESAQQALDLHYRKRMQVRDISTRLERTVGAVKLLMFRARKSLKRCLERKVKSQRHD